MVPPPFLKKLSAWLAIAAAVSILVSIAASQILLALAVAALLLSGLPLRWPRIAIPLGLFLLWTLLSLAFSPDPAGGLPQVRKMIVFLTLLTVFSSVRTLRDIGILTIAWAGVGTYTAILGFSQYVRKLMEAAALHRDFYHFYLNQRITGFQDHWMTFSGQQMYLLLMLMAFLLFGRVTKKSAWPAALCAVLICMALYLSWTRMAMIAALAAGLYLLWCWRRWAVAAAPVVLVAAVLVGPPALRERVNSIVHPEAGTDSNTFRLIVWRTGWEMIEAHPLLGVGPEQIGNEKVFLSYMPKDIPRPLPPGFYKHLHSIYIHYAAERGIPATLFLTGALIMALVDFQKALRRLPPGRSERRFLLHWASAAVIGTMIVGIADVNLGLTDELTMFLVVMCLGYAAAEGISGNALL
ncbi:MAG TPA: O-antigen ligase family protein [Bryobacteraceae bacterium]